MIFSKPHNELSEREVLDRALKAIWDPFLRSHGFQGSGRKFKRITETAVHFVSVDGFWCGGIFAINLDCYWRAVPPVWGEKPTSVGRITSTKSQFSCRLISPEDERAGRCDHHWKMTCDQRTVVREVHNVCETLTNWGFCWLQVSCQPAEVLRTWEAGGGDALLVRYGTGRGYPVLIAHALVETGQFAKALPLVNEFLTQEDPSIFSQEYLEFARSLRDLCN